MVEILLMLAVRLRAYGYLDRAEWVVGDVNLAVDRLVASAIRYAAKAFARLRRASI
jgi:hypothetical protein